MSDPQFITNSVWHGLSSLQRSLIPLAIFTISFGISLLLAHGVIPSLVETGEAPQKAARLRPLFYMAALVSLAAVAVFLGMAVHFSDVISRFYDRWWY